MFYQMMSSSSSVPSTVNYIYNVVRVLSSWVYTIDKVEIETTTLSSRQVAPLFSLLPLAYTQITRFPSNIPGAR